MGDIAPPHRRARGFDLVEAGGHEDAHLKPDEFFQRDADHARFQRPVDPLARAVDETPAQNPFGPMRDIPVKLCLRRDARADDMAVGQAGADREQELVAGLKPGQLVADDRL